MSHSNGSDNGEPEEFYAWLNIKYDDRNEAKALIPNAIAFDSANKSWYLKQEYAEHHTEYLDFIADKAKLSSSASRTPKKPKLAHPADRTSSSTSWTKNGDTSTIAKVPTNFDLAKSKNNTIKDLVTEAAEYILEINPTAREQIVLIKQFADSGFEKFNDIIVKDMIKNYYGTTTMEEAKLLFYTYFNSSIPHKLNSLQEEKNKPKVVETLTVVSNNNQPAMTTTAAAMMPTGMEELLKGLQAQMAQQMQALEQKLQMKAPMIEAATSSANHSFAESTSRVAADEQIARVAAEAEVARVAAEAESARIFAELEAARVAEAKESHGSRKKKGT